MSWPLSTQSVGISMQQQQMMIKANFDEFEHHLISTE
jgi:hypothetical protein